MKNHHQICISSPPDREKLVAEIFFENSQWAEINQESGSLQIEFYPRTDGQPLRLAYDVAIAALEDARRSLLGEE